MLEARSDWKKYNILKKNYKKMLDKIGIITNTLSFFFYIYTNLGIINLNNLRF